MLTEETTMTYEESVKYFEGDEFAAKVFVDKYALQNSNGEYLELTPKDMHHRLAKEFSRIEQKYPNPTIPTNQLMGRLMNVFLLLFCKYAA